MSGYFNIQRKKSPVVQNEDGNDKALSQNVALSNLARI